MQDRLVINGKVLASIEFADELAPHVKDWDVSFKVETEAGLRGVVEAFGGIERFDGTDRLYSYHPEGEPFGRPRSAGGRLVAVHLWLSDELARVPAPKPPAVMEKLRLEASRRVLSVVGDPAAEQVRGESRQARYGG